MAKTKPTIPSQKKAYAALKGRINQYSLLVQGVFDTLAKEAATVVSKTGYAGSAPFHFKDYPQTADAVRKIQEEYVSGISGIIHRSTAEEWKNSNLAQDLIADKAWTFYWKQSKATGKYAKIYHQTNPDALKAFQERKDKGMGLDAKLWKQTPWYKEHLETAISTAIQKGDSAQTLGKNIISHLADYSKMSKEYKARYGKDAECPNCVYAAQRLARTEINMAYRMAEQKRWQQFDFVLGYEIKTSESHRINDICNHVVGRYPKTFVFKGWHPACFCYCLPILKTEDEYFDDAPTPVTQPEPVETFPDGFSQWIGDNCPRVLTADGKGTLPYWLTDNKHVRDCAVAMGKAREFGEALQHAAESVAQGGTVVTEINYKSFASMYRKLMSTCQGNIDYVNDAVRTTIIADAQDIQGIIAELKKHPDFCGYHHQSPYKFHGYSGNIVNLRASNGIMGEIQVSTPKMIYAKETEQVARKILGDAVWEDIAAETGMPGGVGHKLYEEMRVLDKHKHKAKLADLSKQSQKYYAHFHSTFDTTEVKLFTQAEALLAQEADFAGLGVDFSIVKNAMATGNYKPLLFGNGSLTMSLTNTKHSILNGAKNAITVASTVAEVDSTALQAAVKGGKLLDIKKLTAQLDADIKAMVAREQAISDIIPDVDTWHKQFSISDLEGVHKAVKSKIAPWQSLALDEQKAKLEFEVDWVTKHPKYSTSPVAKAAYEKALADVVDKIDWNNIKSVLPDFDAFAKTTHSLKFVSMLSDFKAAIASNDKTLATQLAKDVADMKANLIAKAAKKAGASATSTAGVFDAAAYTDARKNAAIWCKSETESHSLWDADSNNAWNAASAGEKNAWSAYTGGSGHMNRPLRGYHKNWYNSWGIGKVPLNTEGGEAHIRDFYNLIERSTFATDRWLQRGVTWEGVKGLFGLKNLTRDMLKKAVGQEVTDFSFVSCGSAKGSGFPGTILNIYCPKGTKGIYVSPHSHFTYENETVLQLGTRFRITKVVAPPSGPVYIDLEVVGYDKHPQI